jgi:uracil-DNA glycosylase family 4
MSKTERVSALKAETIEALTPTLTPDQRQVVFGSGDPTSPLMLVGEAPGPQEDQQGEPFVGKSGQLLQQVLGELGLNRSQIWISNVVKVWPTTRNGKSLKTRPPTAAEKKASRPYFDRELEIIQPQVILCLGGTAAQALLGKDFKITAARGEFREGPLGTDTIATLHPSYILRLQGMAPLDYEQAIANFRADVRKAVEKAGLLKG